MAPFTLAPSAYSFSIWLAAIPRTCSRVPVSSPTLTMLLKNSENMPGYRARELEKLSPFITPSFTRESAWRKTRLPVWSAKIPSARGKESPAAAITWRFLQKKILSFRPTPSVGRENLNFFLAEFSGTARTRINPSCRRRRASRFSSSASLTPFFSLPSMDFAK